MHKEFFISTIFIDLTTPAQVRLGQWLDRLSAPIWNPNLTRDLISL